MLVCLFKLVSLSKPVKGSDNSNDTSLLQSLSIFRKLCVYRPLGLSYKAILFITYEWDKNTRVQVLGKPWVNVRSLL
jgi:hypothetical protein